MKALIRNTEVYKETEWSPFTANHLEWKRAANPDGDGYALAENCPKDAMAQDFDIVFKNGVGTATLNTSRYNARLAGETAEETATVTVDEEIVVDNDVVIINGVEYTKEELRQLLGE